MTCSSCTACKNRCPSKGYTHMFKKCWYMYTCRHTDTDLQLCRTMLPLSQDAFIEKTLPQGVAYPILPHLVLQQELSSTWKEES